MATRKKISTARKPSGRRGVAPKISDEAVAAKTGKTWKEWFGILDRERASKKTHQEIVAILAKGYRLGMWWQQMVAVSYEQAKGLRARHEKPEGFQITRSKTIAAPVEEVFEAWGDARQRAQWLPGSRLTIRKATENKTLGITWGDGTMIEVGLFSKAGAKTQVAVQHGKLATARVAASQKVFWGEALDRVAQLLST